MQSVFCVETYKGETHPSLQGRSKSTNLEILLNTVII